MRQVTKAEWEGLFKDIKRDERARIRREQAQTIAWMRGCIDRFGDFKQWADRLEEATRDA